MHVKALLDLRDAGMVKARLTGDARCSSPYQSCPLVWNTTNAHKRYRRRFVSLTETADELVCMTYAAVAFHRRKGQNTNIEIVDGRVSDYQELARTGLLSIQWADDGPWTVATTEKGLSYVRGDFMDEESGMNINITNSPTFNNTNVGSVANATAKTEPTSIEMAIEAIRASAADDDVKQSARSRCCRYWRSSERRQHREVRGCPGEYRLYREEHYRSRNHAVSRYRRAHFEVLRVNQ